MGPHRTTLRDQLTCASEQVGKDHTHTPIGRYHQEAGASAEWKQPVVEEIRIVGYKDSSEAPCSCKNRFIIVISNSSSIRLHDIKMSVTHDINSPWFNICVGKKLGFWRAAVIASRLLKRHLIVKEWPYGPVNGRNSLISMTVGILHRIYVTETINPINS